METNEPAIILFVNAVTLVKNGLYLEAIAKFNQIAQEFPKSDLADDALYNAGLCHFHLSAFETAIAIFKSVINDYPLADIYTDETFNEHGKTPAKCHYAIINCFLGMGQLDNASLELKQLINYPDSYTQTQDGERVSFFDLANKAIETYSKLTKVNV